MIVGPVTVEIVPANPDAISLSLRSVFDVLEASRSAREHVADRFSDLFSAEGGDLSLEIRAESVDLLFAEPVVRTAAGAFEFLIDPSERYLELVAAVASYGNARVDLDCHDWPILSAGGRIPTVAEPARAGNAGGGGTQ